MATDVADNVSGGPITQAAALLSTVMYCRKQALELQACKAHSAAPSCERQEAAFTTCSHEHVGQVIQTLVKVAETKCPSEMYELQRCRAHSPGSSCEAEDMESMLCASLHVLRSAQAKAR